MLLIGQNEAHYGPLIGQYSPGDTLTLLPLMDDGDVQTPLGRGGAALVLHTRMTHLRGYESDSDDNDDDIPG